MSPCWITVKKAAGLFGKSEETIRRWCNEGRLNAVKDPGGRDWLIQINPEVLSSPTRRRIISGGLK